MDIVSGPFIFLGPDFTKVREFYMALSTNPSTSFSSNWLEFAGDFTGDGWPDVLLASTSGTRLYVNPKGEPRRWDSIAGVVPPAPGSPFGFTYNRVRPEVAGALALGAAHDLGPRELLAERHREVGVGLVVAVADVEPRVELLDPAVLELEGLDLGRDDGPLDARAGAHHRRGAVVQRRDVLEVGGQPLRAGSWPCRRR